MIKHEMEVMCEATQFLNPMKLPVTVVDVTQFALAKLTLWCCPLLHTLKKAMRNLHCLVVCMLRSPRARSLANIWRHLAEAGITSLKQISHRQIQPTTTRHAHLISLLVKLQQVVCQDEIGGQVDLILIKHGDGT